MRVALLNDFFEQSDRLQPCSLGARLRGVCKNTADHMATRVLSPKLFALGTGCVFLCPIYERGSVIPDLESVNQGTVTCEKPELCSMGSRGKSWGREVFFLGFLPPAAMFMCFQRAMRVAIVPVGLSWTRLSRFCAGYTR